MSNKDCLYVKTLVTESSYADKLELCCDDPIIEDVLDYIARVKIISCKVLKTNNSYRLIIKGIKIIKIRYVCKDDCGKIYFKEFLSPFFEMIPISPCARSINVNANLTYYTVDLLDCKNFVFNNILAFYIKLSFTSNTPNITCDNLTDKCDDDWHFKNDCYTETFSKTSCNNFRKPRCSNNSCKYNNFRYSKNNSVN